MHRGKHQTTVAALFLLISVVLSACQSENAVQPTNTLNVVQEVATKAASIAPTKEKSASTPQPLLEPIPEASTSVLSPELVTLLSYIPAAWADQHLPGFFGPTLYLINVAQIRTDLEIPPVTGVDSRKDKLDLLLGLNTQGLKWVPKEIEPTSSVAVDEWGWDIADVGQILCLQDYETTIILGGFERPEIRDRLIEKGYVETEIGDFMLFSADDTNLQFALKPDTLIISGAAKETQLIELIATQITTNRLPGLETHSSIIPVLEHFEGIWGALLAPSPDWVTFSDHLNIDNWLSLPQDVAENLKEMLKDKRPAQPFAWDFMAITFRGSEKQTYLQFLYHYSSNEEASKDVELVATTLTETPSVASRGGRWADLMSLDDVEIYDAVLVAQARTQSKELIGNAVEHLDYWAFVPLR
jgi:hypothetical protein